MANIKILVDSGATDNFISPKLLKRLALGSKPLDWMKKIWNINGTENRSGMLHQFTDLEVQTGSKIKVMQFLITDLGLKDMILGYPWLAAFEPRIYWKSAVLDDTHLPVVIRSLNQKGREDATVISQGLTEVQKEDIITQLNPRSHLYATISTELAQKACQYTKAVTNPPHFQHFAKVFNEQEAQHFPPSWPWDHMIKLKDRAPKAIDCKIYPVSPKEDISLHKWLKEQ